MGLVDKSKVVMEIFKGLNLNDRVINSKLGAEGRIISIALYRGLEQISITCYTPFDKMFHVNRETFDKDWKIVNDA